MGGISFRGREGLGTAGSSTVCYSFYVASYYPFDMEFDHDSD